MWAISAAENHPMAARNRHTRYACGSCSIVNLTASLSAITSPLLPAAAAQKPAGGKFGLRVRSIACVSAGEMCAC